MIYFRKRPKAGNRIRDSVVKNGLGRPNDTTTFSPKTEGLAKCFMTAQRLYSATRWTFLDRTSCDSSSVGVSAKPGVRRVENALKDPASCGLDVLHL